MKEGDSLLKVKLSILKSIESTNKFAQNHSKIQCRSRCTGCCKRLIKITIAEAIIMLQSITDDEVRDKIIEKSKKLADLSLSSNNNTWFKMNIDCPMLSDDSLCQVYQVRPVLCSTRFSETHPHLCEPWCCSSKTNKAIDDVDTYKEFIRELENSGLSRNVLLQVLPIPAAIMASSIVMKTKWKEWEQVIKMMVSKP